MHDFDQYRQRLADRPEEWTELDGLCRITVTRFCREWPAFERLGDDFLPQLAAQAGRCGRTELRAWSAGCGGGEEPYSLRLLWDLSVAPACPSTVLDIVATDADAVMLQRAQRATYRPGSLREMPDEWIALAFEPLDGRFRLRREFRHDIRFELQDIREQMPAGRFDLVLCRYLAFTYFDVDRQRAMLDDIAQRLRRGGLLMIGRKEQLPRPASGFAPADAGLGLWRRGDAP